MLQNGYIGLLQQGLQRKDFSCTELTNRYLSAIEAGNARLGAYVSVTAESALQAALAVDQKIARGEALAPLEGIPMTLKDNISTKDIATTCCSRMLQNYLPIYDASVWQALRAQNAVLLGKSNMDEFAMGSSCETSVFGGANNPYDTSRVAGGSSGGGAAAVGGGLAAYALGSDTGGSVRQPASFCGLVGLKPTYGTVSRYGLIAYASGFDQIGPITRTATDAQRVWQAISFHDAHDSTSYPADARIQAPCVPMQSLRIGIVREWMECCSPAVTAAIEQALEVYRTMGARIVELSMSALRLAVPVYYILACAEASSNLGRYDGLRYGYRATANQDTTLDELICRTRSEGFGPEVQKRILLGTYVLSAGYHDAYYGKAQKLRGAVIKAFATAFESCDVLLSPTVPTTAFAHGQAAQNPIETYQSDICTVPANIAGLPAVSLPCGFDGNGLPIGLQLMGPAFSEQRLLDAAHRFETQTDGAYLCRTATEVSI